MSLQSQTSLNLVLQMIKKCGVNENICNCIKEEYEHFGRLPSEVVEKLANAVVHKTYFWFWLYKEHKCLNLIKLLATRAGGFANLSPPREIFIFGDFIVDMVDIFRELNENDKKSFEILITNTINNGIKNEQELKYNYLNIALILIREEVYNTYTKKIIDQLNCIYEIKIIVDMAIYYNNIELIKYAVDKCKYSDKLIKDYFLAYAKKLNRTEVIQYLEKI